MAGVSGFCYLSSGAGPGSSHAIGVSAPFTVWAVGTLLGAGIITRTASSYAGVQEMCISPAQREACVQNQLAWPMPKYATDSSESVHITFLTVGASVWEL